MLKLNDFMNPELQQEGIALMRCLKNSLKRNIILPSFKLKKAQANSEYQTLLTSHNFEHKDLYLLFEHLYNKDEMSVSDRNLIRRILLTIFPEALISAGGKKLVSCTRYLNFQKGQKFEGNNMFYLLMKGTIKLQSPFYQKKVQAGMYFGHLELLSGSNQCTLLGKAESDSSLICLSRKDFQQILKHYFIKLNQSKQNLLPKIFTERLQQIQILLMCEEMSRKQYPIGHKLNKKGEQLSEVLFIQSGKTNENYELQALQRKYKLESVIGLIELIVGSSQYLTDNFTLEQTKAYSIPAAKLKRIVEQELLTSMKGDSRVTANYLDQSFKQRSKTEESQRQSKLQVQIESLKKFMRIRKVNLPYTKIKSPLSDGIDSTEVSKLSRSIEKLNKNYEASFIFIKSTQTPERSKQGRANRSFSLIRQQPETQFKRYLDHIDIPSLAQFKATESQLI